MKFIRLLLTCLALAIALVVLLVAAAFAPTVQTWVAQAVLAEHPGLRGSLGSLSAGPAKVDVADLRLELDGAVLTLPSLEVGLPLKTAAWDRKVTVRSLVAKGWTLDLSRIAESKEAPAPVVSAPEGGGAGASAQTETTPVQKVEDVFRGIFSGWKLPGDGSLDGVDLEGDVLVPALPGTTPARVHVIVKGGGLAAGREGDFAFDASSAAVDSDFRVIDLTAHGQLAVAMESPRTLKRIEFKGDLSAAGGSLPQNLTLSADLAVVRGAGEKTYTLGLSRGGRHLATVLARFPEATRRWVGTWKVDLRDSDLAPFVPDQPLPSGAAAGEGDFDADLTFSRVHALGRLNVAASHWGVLLPPLDRLGTVTLDTRFDLARSGRSIRVDHLSFSVAGARPVAVVQSLQPFDFDEKTGDLKVADPRGDWIEGSIQGFPLAWLSGLPSGLAFAGGDAIGEFVVRAADGGFALRLKAPLTAAGVSVQSKGRMLGRRLDLSLSLLADYAPEGWHVQWMPLTIASGGRRLATFEGKASRSPGADEPIALSGTWNADLEALASQLVVSGISWIKGHSASGRFSASLGSPTVVEGDLVVAGRDPNRSVTASVRANFRADGAVTFSAPVKVAIGSSVSEVSAEGTWAGEGEGSRVEVRLSSENVALEHLRLLAAPLASAGGAPWPASSAALTGGPKTPAGARDRIPFWGDWVGRVTVAFDRLRTGDQDFNDVGGVFNIDHGSLRLEGGRGGLPHHQPVKMEGSISFDGAAKFPYGLKATAALDEIDAAPLFAAPQKGEDPLVEGHFSIAGEFTGSGNNLEDLAGRTQGKFRVTSASTGGIIRLLKTSVAEAIPQVSTPVKDGLGTVGSLVGSLLGRKEDTFKSGDNPVSKNADAVLNFTYQVSEIGYDQIAFTALRGSDGTIHLLDIAMNAADERLTGSGQITGVKGRSLFEQPLSLDLQLGARGGIAQLLTTAGLISSQKDSLGYTMMNQPIHFGGTLEHIDGSQWHDLLAKATTRKP